MTVNFSYNLATDVGLCRAIFPDTDSSNPVFSDDEWQAFLSLEGSVRLARARGLEVAAGDLVLTLRVTKILGLDVDGAAAGRELRLQAKEERDRAGEANALDDAQTGGLFDIAEWVVDDFSYRERLAGDLMRSGL